MRFSVALLILALVLPWVARAQSEQFRRMSVVRLNNGTNSVDLDGDGTADLVVRAWAEISNAHSYDILTFYIGNSSADSALNLVLFADSPSASRSDAFRTTRGAECTLTDLRLLQPRSGAAVIVIARREFGTSYADSLPVSFTVYRLHHHHDAAPGTPRYLFVGERTFQSPNRYCDVNKAFRAELGLGDYR